MFNFSSLLSQPDVLACLEEMHDPITKKYLQHAMIIEPCGHSVNALVLNMLSSIVPQRPGSHVCPKCSKPIVRYLPNHAMQDLEPFIHQIQTQAAVVLPSITDFLARKNKILVPFLAKKSDLECSSPWQQIDPGGPNKPIRMMIFEGTGCISMVQVYGYVEGDIAISITCNSRYREDFKNYLFHSGFPISDFQGTFHAIRDPAVNWTIRFLMANGAFQQNNLKFLQQLFKEKNWLLVEQERQAVNLISSVLDSDDMPNEGISKIFENAVTLAPCGHSFSEEFVWESKTCPQCTQHIETILPNHALRAIEELFRRIQTHLDTEQRIEPLPLPPFPGKAACFQYLCRWHEVTPGPGIAMCREIQLKSTISDSFLDKVSVRGFPDGMIDVILEFREFHGEAFKNYLVQLGLHANPEGYFIARLRREFDWASRLLQNHTFPEDALEFLQQLIEAQRWPSVVHARQWLSVEPSSL